MGFMRHKYQIYDFMEKFQTQGKGIILWKNSIHMEIEDNEASDKAAKEAVEMVEMTTTALPTQITSLSLEELETKKGIVVRKRVLVSMWQQIPYIHMQILIM